MSLISEALKKARLESGDREEGLPIGHRPGPPKSRTPLWPWLVASISLSLAGGIVVGVLLPRAGGPETARSTSSASSTGGMAPTPAPPVLQHTDAGTPRSAPEPETDEGSNPGESGGGRGELPGPPDSRESAEAETLPARRAIASRAATAGSQEPAPPQKEIESPPETDARPTAGSGPGTIRPSETAPAATPSPSPHAAPTDTGLRGTARGSAGPEPGSSHHRQIVLPDGSEIVLGGIAISAGTAAVLINGEVLAPGDSRNGWRLVRAETGRVEIEWEGVRFFLEL